MTLDSKKMGRALSASELNAVESSLQPELRAMGHSETTKLRNRLRTMRDKAQDVLQRQRREMRGKTSARGSRVATDDSGSAEKLKILSAAVVRVDRKLARAVTKKRAPQSTLSKAALKMKKKRPVSKRHSAGGTAGKGMASKENKTLAPSGAFGAEGQRPVLERSRKVR